MRRNFFGLTLGLAVLLTLGGCTRQMTPAVTPDPSPKITTPVITSDPAATRPSVTDDANYKVGTDGMVEGTPPLVTTSPAGTTVREAADKARTGVRHAVEDVERVVEDKMY